MWDIIQECENQLVFRKDGQNTNLQIIVDNEMLSVEDFYFAQRVVDALNTAEQK